MNLAALASYVCSKARATDAYSVGLCKGYLSARFQMIWEAELWRQSLVVVTTTLDPTKPTANNGLDALGMWLMPTIAEKIVALRDHDRSYTVTSAEEYFQCDLDEFGVVGTAVSFYVLPSCVAMIGTPQIFYQQSSLAENANLTGNVRGIRSDPTLPVGNPGTFDGTTIISNGEQAVDNWKWSEMTSFTKPVTAGVVTLGYQPPGLTPKVPLVVLQPTDTAAPQLCRIQLVEIPVAAVNLRALVKRRMIPFSNDQDVPTIKGLDNCLIAFAMADLLQQRRQYAKAQALMQEAEALLLDAKKGEVYQQSSRPHIVPAVEPPSSVYNADGFQQKGYW